MNGEMPKMPEPNGYIVGLQWIRHKQTANSLSEEPLEVYTADQMRAYAQEASRLAMERAYDAMFDIKGDKETRFNAQVAIRALSDMPAQEVGK